MNKISIIVPIYNVENYIVRCLNSIINQTYTNIEIILVDDGSPDNCPQICDEYAKRDSRIRVIHKANGGLSDARNAGMRIATGDWFGFVDSDDFVHPQMYEILLNNALTTNAELSVCDYCLTLEEEEGQFSLDNKVKVIDQPIYDFICNKAFSVNAWNKLYKRSLFNDLEYPVGLLYEDLATTYKVVNLAERVTVTDAKLYAYIQRSNSIMGSTRFMMKKDKVTIVREMWDFFEQSNLSAKREYLRATLEYCLSDVFNMLGSGTWKTNTNYRKALKEFVFTNNKIINIELNISFYRRTVLFLALLFPKITEVAFQLKKR